MDKNLLIIEHEEIHCSGNVEVIIPESSRSKNTKRSQRTVISRASLFIKYL
jgi:hypothetical protein